MRGRGVTSTKMDGPFPSWKRLYWFLQKRGMGSPESHFLCISYKKDPSWKVQSKGTKNWTVPSDWIPKNPGAFTSLKVRVRYCILTIRQARYISVKEAWMLFNLWVISCDIDYMAHVLRYVVNYIYRRCYDKSGKDWRAFLGNRYCMLFCSLYWYEQSHSKWIIVNNMSVCLLILHTSFG